MSFWKRTPKAVEVEQAYDDVHFSRTGYQRGVNIPVEAAVHNHVLNTGENAISDSTAFLVRPFALKELRDFFKEISSARREDGLPDFPKIGSLRTVFSGIFVPKLIQQDGVTDFIFDDIILKSPDLNKDHLKTFGEDFLRGLVTETLGKAKGMPYRDLEHSVEIRLDELGANDGMHIDHQGVGNRLKASVGYELSTQGELGPVVQADVSPWYLGASYIGPLTDQDGQALTELFSPDRLQFMLWRNASFAHRGPSVGADDVTNGFRHGVVTTHDLGTFILSLNEVCDKAIENRKLPSSEDLISRLEFNRDLLELGKALERSNQQAMWNLGD